jgi:hypothetical protein
MRQQLRELAGRADAYFDQAHRALAEAHTGPYSLYAVSGHDYWAELPEAIQDAGTALVTDVLAFTGKLAEASRSGALTSTEDTTEVRVAAKKMRAAIRLTRYFYQEPEVVHDEGTVLGFRPASQSEGGALPPPTAKAEFRENAGVLSDVLRLVESSGHADMAVSGSQVGSPAAAQRFRPGTAFLMMWMDPAQPALLDVMDAVKETFARFDIRAIRADDIEHEGLISDRVLNEIRTAEFLFADLTGTRPNVYYEVGYAHALNKRVMLFRQGGTNLHFDLAGYNCPEYSGLRDLREKLTKRLIELTNKNPNDATGI